MYVFANPKAQSNIITNFDAEVKEFPRKNPEILNTLNFLDSQCYESDYDDQFRVGKDRCFFFHSPAFVTALTAAGAVQWVSLVDIQT